MPLQLIPSVQKSQPVVMLCQAEEYIAFCALAVLQGWQVHPAAIPTPLTLLCPAAAASLFFMGCGSTFCFPRAVSAELA